MGHGTMSAPRRALFIAAFALGCGSDEAEVRVCNDGGSPSFLEGSYCEDVEMTFTEVRTKLQRETTDTLIVEYVEPRGDTAIKTLEIRVLGQNVNLDPNVAINLVSSGSQVRRVLPEGVISLTNELEMRSTVTLSEYQGQLGTPVKGKFDILFKTGRTLSGEFEGTLVDARPSGTN